MPSFDDHAHSAAPPEEVWKLLYDPTRFTEWWVGVASVDPDPVGDKYTMYPAGYADFPMPQLLCTDRVGQRVTISCLVSDLRFDWRLRPSADGAATDIEVHVDIPDEEAARLATQRDVIRRSVANLAALATATGDQLHRRTEGGLV
ncbi:MAG TPA: SRPBCC family protein [Pseudonocardiaceae bacterium]